MFISPCELPFMNRYVCLRRGLARQTGAVLLGAVDLGAEAIPTLHVCA